MRDNIESMDHHEKLKYKWLRFSIECGVFGTKNKHLGFIVSTDEENLFCVAVNVTSKWDARDKARIDRGDPKEVLSWIRAKSQKGSYHFSEDSVIDCAFPKKISYDDFDRMIEDGKIELVSPGEDVCEELIDEVSRGILASRIVPAIIKKTLSS